MKFMLIMKSTKDSEAGVPPTAEQMLTMIKHHEEMVKAGVLLAAEGTHPSSKGARVRFAGTKRTVIDGPFTETKELIAGFWLIQVRSKEEAIEWVKRFPNIWREDTEIEIRQVATAEDFEAPPEVTEQLVRLHEDAAHKARADGDHQRAAELERDAQEARRGAKSAGAR